MPRMWSFLLILALTSGIAWTNDYRSTAVGPVISTLSPRDFVRELTITVFDDCIIRLPQKSDLSASIAGGQVTIINRGAYPVIIEPQWGYPLNNTTASYVLMPSDTDIPTAVIILFTGTGYVTIGKETP